MGPLAARETGVVQAIEETLQSGGRPRHDDFWPGIQNFGCQQFDISARRQRIHLVKVATAADDIQSIGPDGACRAQDGERLHSSGANTSRICGRISYRITGYRTTTVNVWECLTSFWEEV